MDVCAVARVTSEWLLVELFGAEEGRAAFRLAARGSHSSRAVRWACSRTIWCGKS